MTLIYQSSDLNRRGRAILDTAHEGWARIRDTDGTSLIMTREDSLLSIQERDSRLSFLASSMATFLSVSLAVDSSEELSAEDFEDWSWLRYLDREDVEEFLMDVREAIHVDCRDHSSNSLPSTVEDWKETAFALSDSLSRETLLGRSHPDDFVEVQRPEGVDSVSGTGGSAATTI